MHPRRRPRPAPLAALGVAAMVLAACASGPPSTGTPAARATTKPSSVPSLTPSTAPTTVPTTAPPTIPPTSTPTVAPTTAPVLAPLPVPSGRAYLGAWVNPAGQPRGKGSQQMAQLPSFQQQVGRSMAILHLYDGFRQPAPLAALSAIEANGSVPRLDWGCADPAQVVSGQDDAIITAYAQALKNFAHPVLLRWAWEMNLKATAARCNISDPATFVAAWRHLWTIFHQQGAANVAFVWCPGLSGGLASMTPLYPGDAYVDWIGVDGYDRANLGATGFATLFGPWYAQWSTHDRPLMIGETGSQPPAQAAYLAGVRQVLPTQFPAIKAFVYFDAPGPAGQWQLTGPGLAAFAQMAGDPYFSAQP